MLEPETVLLRAGYWMLAVGALCGAGMLVDSRTLMGVSTWLKPLKFCLSVGVYLITLGWLMPYLAASGSVKRLLAYGLTLSIGVAWALIVLQGARGVTSHYNASSPFNAAVFSAMGISIGINTLLLTWLTVEFFRHAAPAVPSALLWGIRLGLLSAVIGSVQGAAMIRMNAHTVGAPDGGPGLPLVNFSTMAGDLRIAHAVALHGLQILPLAGWFLSQAQVPRGALLVWILFAADMGLFAVTHLQALSGKPIFAYHPKHSA